MQALDDHKRERERERESFYSRGIPSTCVQGNSFITDRAEMEHAGSPKRTVLIDGVEWAAPISTEGPPKRTLTGTTMPRWTARNIC